MKSSECYVIHSDGGYLFIEQESNEAVYVYMTPNVLGAEFFDTKEEAQEKIEELKKGQSGPFYFAFPQGVPQNMSPSKVIVIIEK